MSPKMSVGNLDAPGFECHVRGLRLALISGAFAFVTDSMETPSPTAELTGWRKRTRVAECRPRSDRSL